MTSLYWSVAPWYLMAWFTALIGIPAGLLARKRLTSRPWGPMYDSDDDKEKTISKGSLDTAHGPDAFAYPDG